MREMSAWSIAASLFFSISLMTSANEVVGSAVSLAGAGNPAAVQRGLTDFVARMGGGAPVPQAVANAAGHAAAMSTESRSAAAARLQREKDLVDAQGTVDTLPANLSGLFGLTDGRSGILVKGLLWNDDNDHSQHYCEVVQGKPYMIVAYKAPDGSVIINWLTDVNGTLYRTVYVQNNILRIVPNADYSAEFTAQLSYWDAIVPAPPTGVASNASGS